MTGGIRIRRGNQPANLVRRELIPAVPAAQRPIHRVRNARRDGTRPARGIGAVHLARRARTRPARGIRAVHVARRARTRPARGIRAVRTARQTIIRRPVRRPVPNAPLINVRRRDRRRAAVAVAPAMRATTRRGTLAKRKAIVARRTAIAARARRVQATNAPTCRAVRASSATTTTDVRTFRGIARRTAIAARAKNAQATNASAYRAIRDRNATITTGAKHPAHKRVQVLRIMLPVRRDTLVKATVVQNAALVRTEERTVVTAIITRFPPATDRVRDQ